MDRTTHWPSTTSRRRTRERIRALLNLMLIWNWRYVKETYTQYWNTWSLTYKQPWFYLILKFYFTNFLQIWYFFNSNIQNRLKGEFLYEVCSIRYVTIVTSIVDWVNSNALNLKKYVTQDGKFQVEVVDAVVPDAPNITETQLVEGGRGAFNCK